MRSRSLYPADEIDTNVLDPAVDLPQDRELPCRSVDPELFFAESTTDIERAKSLCQECPVRLRCFVGALERREPWGVWGGEVFVMGRVVPRKRGRGRPRKDQTAIAERYAA